MSHAPETLDHLKANFARIWEIIEEEENVEPAPLPAQ